MNLFDLFIKIGVDDQASEKVGNISQKLGNGLKAAAKVGTAAVAAAGTAVVALVKQSVDAYADFEQLQGGAELMFGDGYNTVMKNAKEAYKTVQMSQNEYLKQVNGFAVGLKTSLGGNGKAAAELSHKIVKAEADIVAATGNSAENVQNAFNGIMKNNFTMLDNLGLGINATKEGFQEIIDKVNEANGTEYRIGNLADMQSALVAYVEMQGLANYAADEGAKTIQGSVSAMKASWENLLVSFTDTNSSVEDSISAFVETAENVLTNILPVIETSLVGVGDLLGSLIPTIVEKLPTYIEEYLPMLAEIVVTIIQSLVTALTDNSQMIVDTIMQVLTTLITAILEMLPMILELGLDLIIALATGIANNVDTLVPAIVECVLKLVEVLTNPDTLSQLIEAAVLLVTELADGLIDAIPQLVDAAIMLVMNLVEFLTNPEKISMLIAAALKIVVALVKGLINARAQLVSGALKLIRALIDKFKETDWGAIGKSIVDGLKKGIKDSWHKIKTFFKEKIQELTSNVKELLGIHSPSRVFAEIGKNMALGVGVGWNDNFPEDDIVDSLAFNDADYGYQTATTTTIDRGRINDYNSLNQQVNVTVGIDDGASALGLARALLPFIKIVEKEKGYA